MNIEEKNVKENAAPNEHREELTEEAAEVVTGGIGGGAIWPGVSSITELMRTSKMDPKERRAGMLLDKMREQNAGV